jgi:hypothetical protein
MHPRLWQRIFGLTMPLDIEKYRHFVSQFDLSEQEQTELIQTVWTILESFVDHSFGRHPDQQCGTRLEFNDLHAPLESLESKESQPLEKNRPIRYETLKQLDPP